MFNIILFGYIVSKVKFEEINEMNPKYNFEKIESLRKEAEKNNLNFQDKWNQIGNYFGVSASAVRKWYYREKEKLKPKKRITTDQWRTAYLLLTGKNSHAPVAILKQKICMLCKK